MLKRSCLSACKKLTSSLTSFLRYCKEIANLLLWAIWACLAQNQLHPPRFSGNIGKICKLFIFGTLGMPGYAHPK